MSRCNDAFASNTIAVVLAGGKGTRLGVLTRAICKPALPFGAAYRSIDFTLANCVNSGIRRIGVATQHKPGALLRHLDEVWRRRPAAPGEFVAAWRAEERAAARGYRGTADAVYCNLDLIERLDADDVLVLAGDHVYKMDYRPMLRFHRERGADVTIACVHVDPKDARHFGVVSADGTGRIVGFVEKPRTRAELPPGAAVLASMGVYVFDRRFLADALRRDAQDGASRHDFGGDVLPAAIRDARVFAYGFGSDGADAYWRDIGTPRAYWAAHLELLGAAPKLALDDAAWPLPAATAARLTAAHASDRGASELRSLVAEGCTVMGTVDRCVLFPGCVVAPGAYVENAVLLPGAVVGRGARLHGVVVDAGYRVPGGTVVTATRWPAGGVDEPVVMTAENPETVSGQVAAAAALEGLRQAAPA